MAGISAKNSSGDRGAVSSGVVSSTGETYATGTLGHMTSRIAADKRAVRDNDASPG